MSGFSGATEGGVLHGYDVVNNLTSTDPTKVLAAPQGKALKDLIAQSTAVESTTITLDSSIVGSINRSFIRRSGHVVTINLQFIFKTVPTVGTSYAIGEIPVGYRPNYSCEFMGNGVGAFWKNTDLSTFSFSNDGVITVTPRGIATDNWYVLNAVYIVP